MTLSHVNRFQQRPFREHLGIPEVGASVGADPPSMRFTGSTHEGWNPGGPEPDPLRGYFVRLYGLTMADELGVGRAMGHGLGRASQWHWELSHSISWLHKSTIL